MLSIQSPYSAEALVLEVETPFVYSRRTDDCRNVSNVEIGRWLNSHGEVRHVYVQNLAELKNSLGLYADCRTALRLALYSADKELDNSLREQAISFLEPLLNEPNVYIWLQDLFNLQALPEESVKIAKTSLDYAKINGLTHYMSFYSDVLNRQPVIRHVSATWDLIEDSSLFGNQHRDLMDRALGTGLFARIVNSGAEPDMLDMALLVLLKLRPNVGSNITNKLFHAPIINRVVLNYSEILGGKNVVESIEHYGLWPLVDVEDDPTGKPKFSIGLRFTESPFTLGQPLELEDLVIIIGDGKDVTPVPRELTRHLETRITTSPVVRSRILLGNTPAELHNNCGVDENSALRKALGWANTPSTGAFQPSRRIALF